MKHYKKFNHKRDITICFSATTELRCRKANSYIEHPIDRFYWYAIMYLFSIVLSILSAKRAHLFADTDLAAALAAKVVACGDLGK